MDQRFTEVRRLLDRYIVEVVEAYDFCPWAKAARTGGEIAVEVLWGTPTLDHWATAAERLLALPETRVAMVVAPPRKFQSDREKDQAARAYMAASTPEERKAAQMRFADALDPIGSMSRHAEWRALSPGGALTAAGRNLFGNPVPSNFPGFRHWIFAIGVPFILLGLLWRRVRAVEVVA